MDGNINLIAFGTFGNPNGFRQSFFSGNKELSEKVKTFDLNTNAIKLLPNSKIYSIRKENINGINSISYSIYNYAKEQNSSRSGTFIGSSILYIHEIADEDISIRLLNDFNQNLLNKNVLNDTITVIHSDNLSVSKPKDFDITTQYLRQINDINFNQFSNKYLVVYCEVKLDNLKNLFSNSLDLLNVYDTIYFTDSSEVAEFVHLKGIYKIVQINDFKQEIEDRKIERKQNSENLVLNFLNEKKKLEEDKRNLINDLKLQLENNEKLHSENQKILRQSKDDIDSIAEYYLQFSERIDDYLNQIKSGRKIDHVIELYNENKRIFVSSINAAKQPIYIKKIQHVKNNSSLRSDNLQSQPNNHVVPIEVETKSHLGVGNFNFYKISTAFFAFLWVISLIYFLWIKDNELQQSDRNSAQVTDVYSLTQNANDFPNPKDTDFSPTNKPSVDIRQLNPRPNCQLNKNDLDLISRQKINGKTIDEIIDVIFLKNPNDVESHYKNQKEVYSKILMEKNADCFCENTCIKDNLVFIPSFKKP